MRDKNVRVAEEGLMKRLIKNILWYVKRYSLKKEKNSISLSKEPLMRSIKIYYKQLSKNIHIMKLVSLIANGGCFQHNSEQQSNLQKLVLSLKEFPMIEQNASIAIESLLKQLLKDIFLFARKNQKTREIKIKNKLLLIIKADLVYLRNDKVILL